MSKEEEKEQALQYTKMKQFMRETREDMKMGLAVAVQTGTRAFSHSVQHLEGFHRLVHFRRGPLTRRKLFNRCHLAL
jgi:hypothetical protein